MESFYISRLFCVRVELFDRVLVVVNDVGRDF